MSDAINRYQMNNAMIRNLEQVNNQTKTQNGSKPKTAEGTSFQDLLNQQMDRQLSFSRHAVQRTEQRNIQLTSGDLERLENACDKAEKKGIKEALVVMNDAAFIVNAASRTVITALDKNEMKDNVFTNIDGALFI
jgi:flagellar operon protein